MQLTDQFRSLHDSGTFVMPNPFDIGSARLLASLGFPALASTSAGLATSLGKLDMSVTRDELLAHVGLLVSATDLPLNVDSERCFGDDAAAVTETVEMLGAIGAAGCSIEDWDPATQQIDSIDVATQRVAAAVRGASAHGMVLTARCENHLHGVHDLDDTIARLISFRQAGAEVLYAPGLVDPEQITRLVDAVGAPVNMLLLAGGPNVDQLGAVGVRRVSLGSNLSRIAYGAMVAAAQRLAANGTVDPGEPFLQGSVAASAFAS